MITYDQFQQLNILDKVYINGVEGVIYSLESGYLVSSKQVYHRINGIDISKCSLTAAPKKFRIVSDWIEYDGRDLSDFIVGIMYKGKEDFDHIGCKVETKSEECSL